MYIWQTAYEKKYRMKSSLPLSSQSSKPLSSRKTSFRALENIILRCKKKRFRAEITFPQKIDLLIGIANTIEQAHQSGITYRNICLKNILIKYHNEYDVSNPIIIGGYKESSPDNKTTYTLLHLNASPMSQPYQVSNNPIDYAEDWYSFGTICFNLIFLDHFHSLYRLTSYSNNNEKLNITPYQKERALAFIKRLVQTHAENRLIHYADIRHGLVELKQRKPRANYQHVKHPTKQSNTRKDHKHQKKNSTENSTIHRFTTIKTFLLQTVIMTAFLTMFFLTLAKAIQTYRQLPERSEALLNSVSKPTPINSPKKRIL